LAGESELMQRQEWPFTANDGVPLWGSSWRAPAPRAVLSLLHDIGEHSGRYDQVAGALIDAGFSLAAADLRGHGHSGGLRGHIPSYEALLDDAAMLLQETARRFPGLPVFLYGQGLGGNIALNYCLRRRPQLAGALVTSPWLAPREKASRRKVIWRAALNRVRPATTVARPPASEQLSGDPAVAAAYRRDPLVHRRASARLYHGVMEAGQSAVERAAAFPLPLLLMHGESDRFASPFASQAFCNAALVCTFRLWPRLRHELYHERERAAVLAEMVAWLNAQLRESG
jgi:alpha-beta hydrolase superfamily lysophospholipase